MKNFTRNAPRYWECLTRVKHSPTTEGLGGTTVSPDRDATRVEGSFEYSARWFMWLSMILCFTKYSLRKRPHSKQSKIYRNSLTIFADEFTVLL